MSQRGGPPRHGGMQPRIKQPAFVIPEAMAAMRAFSETAKNHGVPAKTIALVHVRVSQINGCAVCLDLHTRPEFFEKDSEARMLTVAAWRDAPFFSDAERAALALAEAVTRLSDREDPVPDAVWNEAAKHYDEKALCALLVAISSVNVWNRLNVATRQVAGAKW